MPEQAPNPPQTDPHQSDQADQTDSDGSSESTESSPSDAVKAVGPEKVPTTDAADEPADQSPDQSPDQRATEADAPPALREPANLWLERLRVERGYSDRTLSSYRYALKTLCEFAGEKPWLEVREADVRLWVAMMARNKLSPRSIAHRLSAWRGFFEFVGQQAPGDQKLPNPAKTIRAPRAPKRLPKALSPDMAHHLTEYEPEDTFEAVRDKAMLELFYSCGLRLSELCALDSSYHNEQSYQSTSWLDTSEALVTVLGKGSKSRTVPVGTAALEAIEYWFEWLEEWREEHPNADPYPLFLSGRGKRLSPRTVQQRLKRLALERGVPANVHPHVLRHSFASHMLQSSGDLRAVQEMLGHASITTTQVYTSLDFQRLAEVYDQAHPRAHSDE